MYALIILGIGLIVLIQKVDSALQNTMDSFLWHGKLSVLEMCHVSVTLPRIVFNLETQRTTKSSIYQTTLIFWGNRMAPLYFHGLWPISHILPSALTSSHELKGGCLIGQGNSSVRKAEIKHLLSAIFWLQTKPITYDILWHFSLL